MNREDYLKAQAAGRARAKRRRSAAASRPESALTKLRRERPEMFSGSYFSEPVRLWKQMRHEPQEWCSKNHVTSQAMTAARERGIASPDPYKSAAARGDLGGFPIRRFKA